MNERPDDHHSPEQDHADAAPHHPSSLWRKSGVNEDGCCVRLERPEISRLASSEDYLGPRLRSASSALAPLRMSLRA
jgi:hypothetical protein